MKRPPKRKYFRVITKVLLNPVYLSERALQSAIYHEIERLHIEPNQKWIDVGCGTRPYEQYFPQGAYVGVDVESSGRSSNLKSPDFFYDGVNLPFADNSFDGAICTQVLEHVASPQKLLAEIHRVVKPGGRILLSLPFVWQEHETPYDFSRFTSFGIVNLLENAGFKVENLIKDTKALESLAIVLNTYIIGNLVPRIRGFGILISIFLCFPIQAVAKALSKVLPDKGHLYLNLVINGSKKTN